MNSIKIKEEYKKCYLAIFAFSLKYVEPFLVNFLLTIKQKTYILCRNFEVWIHYIELLCFQARLVWATAFSSTSTSSTSSSTASSSPSNPATWTWPTWPSWSTTLRWRELWARIPRWPASATSNKGLSATTLQSGSSTGKTNFEAFGLNCLMTSVKN